MILEKHEKFIAFCLLGASLVGIAVMVYLKPPSSAVTQNGAALAILNSIVGALTLAFGGAAGALFKISTSDKAEIGKATADAISAGPPIATTVQQPPENPIPVSDNHLTGDVTTTSTDDQLPDYARG